MFSQFCRRHLVKASFTKAIELQKMLSIVMPAVIVVVPLRSIAEEQARNDEFDLKAAQLSLDQQKLQAVASGEVRVFYASECLTIFC